MTDKSDDASGIGAEPSIDRLAALLITQYGLHAFDFATRRAETLTAQGAAEDSDHWRAIAAAIERELTAELRPSSPANDERDS